MLEPYFELQVASEACLSSDFERPVASKAGLSSHFELAGTQSGSGPANSRAFGCQVLAVH